MRSDGRTSVDLRSVVTVVAAAMLATLAAALAVGPWGPGVPEALAAPAAAPEKAVVEPAQDEAGRMERLTKDVTQGSLRVMKKDGELVECPLKHTDVKVDITGFLARVKVTQTFFNPLNEKIEAVYVFPLPHKSAVDDMTMVLSSGRRIVGLIKRRAEAREIYEQAVAQGATAALLEQERPNIFTQTVGNIDPQEEINIEISYVDVLEYDAGVYEFHFPMVVGPRYIPGQPTSTIPETPPELKGKVGELDKEKVPEGPDKPKGDGWAPDTDRVPDASRITPPVLKPEFRNGHDISLSLNLEAGVPVQDLKVINHKADVKTVGRSMATVKISPADSIPNKDFVLRYAVVGEKPETAVLAHTDEQGRGYFLLMIQPKQDEKLKEAPPRDIVFLIDVSGSMSGPPTDKVRETMGQLLRRCKPDDTIQVVTFASQAQKLFDAPVPASNENMVKALDFTKQIRGSGGTEMLKGVKMALGDPLDPKRVRIVLMLSDGFIGNEAEIIEEVGRQCGDQIRFWCLGIGNSVNRFLIDGVARHGGGMGKVLNLNEDPAETVQDIMMRIHRAQLSKISIDWGAALVSETYPARIPDLWAERPVVLFGRYRDGIGQTAITVSGNIEGQPVSWPLVVNLPAVERQHEVLAKVWARNKVEDLMQQTYYAGSPEVEEEVTRLALDYRLMSQYTSFVAVDETELGKRVEPARPPRRMLVPVPIPEGTRFEGFFGGEGPGGPAEGFVAGEVAMFFNGSSGGGSGNLSYSRAAPPPASTPSPRVAMKKLSEAQDAAVPGYGVYRYPSTDQWAQLTAKRQRFAAGRPTASRGLRAGDGRERLGTSYGIVLGDMDTDKGWEQDRRAGAFFSAAQGQLGAEIAKRAQAVVKKAEQLAADGGSPPAVRSLYAHAWLLDSAAGYAGGEAGAKAQEAIQRIDDELRKAWAKDLPGLEKRLELVIEDDSLEEALAAVAGAAGFKFKVLPGSLADAAGITLQKDVRVTWLDLRRATAAQALDWLLLPARLQWQVAEGEVVVSSARRAAPAAPWIYDVSLIAIPAEDELKDVKDYQKRVEAVKKLYDELLAAVRGKLGLDESSAQWYGAGSLLVCGDAKVHAAVATLVAGLADPKAEFEGALAEVHKLTGARAEARKEGAAKMMAAVARYRVAAAAQEFSWRLLAAAAAGEHDAEALAELKVAWAAPEMAEVLKGEKVPLVCLRSLWAITEAARAVPDDAELAKLANRAREACGAAAAAVVEKYDASRNNPNDLLPVAYVALALRDDAELSAKARKAVDSALVANPQVAVGKIMVSALLAEKASDIDAKALAARLTEGVGGQDMVVLAAMACRRAGGEAWTTFRSEAPNLLGRQMLPGSVVVLVNRLAVSQLPLVAAAK